MFKKIINLLLNLLLLCSTIFFLITTSPNNLSISYKIVLACLSIIFLILYMVFNKFNKLTLKRLFYVLFIFICVGSIIYTLLLRYGVIMIFSSVGGLKDYILSTGQWGILVYILIQALQVVFLPIPAAVICIAGSLIYGPFLGGVYCSIGVLIGSFSSFIIGRTYGHKLVSWIVGEDNCNKYSEIIRKRGAFFLSMAFLLPMFPDDILCLIAGITSMSWLSFSWVTILTRPIGVICMSYFGSGKLIPFTGWGIYVWCVILVLAVAMVYITYRYQDSMQDFVLNKVFKKNKSEKKTKSNHKIS